MPKLGDIHTAHNARFDRYYAFQFTHYDADEGHAVLLLDWWAPTPPCANALKDLKPASLDFMDWNGQLELHWVGHGLPRDSVHLGWRSPLVKGEVNREGGWPDGGGLQRQQWWNALDPAITRAYKAELAGDDSDDTLILERDDFVVERGDSALQGIAMAAAPSLALFDQMPVLISLDVDVPIPGLLPWLETRPLIDELILSGIQEPVLDVRRTALSRLSVDVTGMRAIHLNSRLDTLILRGTASPELVIHDPHEGRWLDVYCTDPDLRWSGLPQLQQITLHGMRRLDATRIAERLPGIRALSVQGAPCRLDNSAQLGALAHLEHLSLVDVFPPAEAPFPAPSYWPQLSTLSLDSVPAELAKAVNASFGPCVADGLVLEIRQPRKPEWLAANMDNPFRDWDDGAGISAAQAKKAAALYRNAHKEALKSASAPTALAEALQRMATTYVEGFNALNRRSGFIGTSECEQILQALDTLLDTAEAAQQVKPGGKHMPLDRRPVLELVEALRAF
ncbi:MAG: hypothetical protein GAK31_01254 [Stenotrophomonas maltophilia]|uniref:Gliding motility protein n=1 Tax=Stenotrophomonas maltophilia TaxID=40324 RepID=A0A7V8JLX3_STEMA|nr:MAG: hypothetical protein GAK31_01254 [Stenotrophomonas maltophilia]